MARRPPPRRAACGDPRRDAPLPMSRVEAPLESRAWRVRHVVGPVDPGWSSFCDFGVRFGLYTISTTGRHGPLSARCHVRIEIDSPTFRSYPPFTGAPRAGMRWCPCLFVHTRTKKGRCPCVSGCPPSTPSHPTLPTSPNGHVPLESPLPAPPRPRAHNVKCASHRPWYSFTHAHSPCPAASRDGNEV